MPFNPGGLTPAQLVQAAQGAAQEGGQFGLTSTGLGYNSPAASAGGNAVYPPAAYLDYLSRAEDREAEYLRYSRTDAEDIRQADREYGRMLADSARAYEVAMAQIAENRGSSSAAAQATVAAAEAHAQAAIEAASIAAEASRYDSDTRLQIAREANAVAREGQQIEKSRIWAEELGRPSQWREQAAFARGWAPEAAGALHQTPAGFLGEGTGAPALPTAPQAIVGEAGPELATATPQGTQITPLQQPTGYQLPKNRTFSGKLPIPRMGGGGMLVDPRDRLRNVGPAALQAAGTGAAPSLSSQYNSRLHQPVTGGQGRNVTPVGSRVPIGGVQYTGPGPTQRSYEQAKEKFNRHWVTGQGWVPGPDPMMAQAAAARAKYGIGSGTTPATGGPGSPGTPPVSIEPPVTLPQSPTDLLFQQMQQPNQASFGAWTGPTTIPGEGITTPVRPPWQLNLQEWTALPYAQKAMLAGTWRSLGMIAGETEAEMMALAEESIRRSAWTGGGPAQTAYGAW